MSPVTATPKDTKPYRRGQRLTGRFRLLSLLSRTKYNEVWRGVHEVSGLQVAIKLPRHDLEPAGRALAKHNLDIEAITLSQFRHPNVVQYLGPAGKGFAMEYLEGQTLVSFIEHPWQVVLTHTLPIVSVLDQMHAHGMIHRDIKPDNIIVTANGSKLIDFGSVPSWCLPTGDNEINPLESDSPRNMCSLMYASPELLQGKDGPAADIWAWGVMLYALLGNQPPYKVNDMRDPRDLLDKHLKTTPTPLMALVGAPPEVCQLIMSCLSLEPTERPSAEEILRQLNPLVA